MTEHEHSNHQEHAHAGHAEHAQSPIAKMTPLLTQMREFKFSFKKQTTKNELGEEVKRPPVTLSLPIPTLDGLIEGISSSEKIQQFVLDLVEEAIKEQAKSQIADEDKPVNTQSELDLTKLSLEFVASMPKSERRGSAISKEALEAWGADYIQVMTPLNLPRSADIKEAGERATRAAKLCIGKFNACRGDKKVLKFLKEQLATWAQHTTETALEENAEIYQYLEERVSALLNKDDVNQLEAL
jgi:hypothetical protein